MAKARQQYFADEVTLQKENRDFAIQPELVEKLESIEAGAQVNVIETVKVNGEALTPDEDKAVDVSVPLVEDTLYSTDTDKALSANQGKVLYEYIQNLASRGRYLSNWNTVTGLPTTSPVDNPYQYHPGDYYVVSNVAALGGTNYRPDGSSYSWGVASTTVETETVKVGDYYTYDGQHWLLLVNTTREIAIDSSLSTTSTNPVENRVVTNALNTKQNNITDLETIRSGAALGATALQPGAGLSELTGTSDDIAQGTTNLFMTTAERSKLSNQSGVNTGDETQLTIKNKLGQASASTDGYLTSTDWNAFNNKQGTISDLETIRSNASAGKNASDTIATYGDVVTHDANEFATASQGAKADTALQSGDNVSELVNDAGYITDAYHDNTKQDKLIAGANIQIAADGKTISATDTTYVAGDFDIKDLADTTGLRTEWSGKQDELIAGTNIQIAADGKTISATDTTYTAGPGISISNNNVISNTQTSAEWGNITGTLSDQTDLNTALGGKQDTLIAGANIQIASDGKTVSATDTTYTAGTGISIDSNNVISSTQSSAEWGNITGTLSDQIDLQSALDAKQDDMVILKYGISTWNDFITAYQKNGVVYCRASSQSNPATGTQGRLAFMAYVNNADNPTEVEFQYYRSRSDHNSAANQLDEVYVYKLNKTTGRTVTTRDTGALLQTNSGSGIGITWGNGKAILSNTGVTSINSQTGDVTLTIPTVPTNVSDFVNDAGYITANDLPTVDTAMSDSSTNAVQNNVIKNYVDTQVQEATSGAVSDTAYSSAWDGITGIAPSKNVVYDKISAMDTTIAGKQDTISDLSTIRTGAGKGATAVQPGDNVSTLTNDAGFITKAVNDLTNYYTKSETYTKAEVADYVANFAGFKVVATLPTTDIKTTIIYLLGPVGTGADKYEEYIYSNNTWVMIGETSVDLTNYFNTSTDNSDSITEGSTNLFLTSAERTKLSNTSGTNTGDETKATIQSKLGAATSSNDGYLTSADWSTFNGKANAADANTKTFFWVGTPSTAEGLEVWNWVSSGKNAVIAYRTQAGELVTEYMMTQYAQRSGSFSGFATFESVGTPGTTLDYGGTYSKSSRGYINIAENGTVTMTTLGGNINYLATDVDYSTVYTPTYDGSPATKKYVDDNVKSNVRLFNLPSQNDDISDIITRLNNGGGVVFYKSYSELATVVGYRYYTVVDYQKQSKIIKAEGEAATISIALTSGTTTVASVTTEGGKVKKFSLSSTSDLTNAQAVLDWYNLGGVPVIFYNSNLYTLQTYEYSSQTGKSYYHFWTNVLSSDGTSISSLKNRKLIIQYNPNGAFPVSVSEGDYTFGTYLKTGVDYSTPYTPEYDGSPATKKYVDDSIPTYIAGSNVTITENCESDMQGPCDSGFHVPLKSEWEGLKTIMTSLSLTTGAQYKTNLHIPFVGYRAYSDGLVRNQANSGDYWASNIEAAGRQNAYYMSLYSSDRNIEYNYFGYGYSIRAFKNEYVAPTSSWTVIAGTLGNAGIFWNSTDGLITVTNGTTGYTIQDKNVGATTVYNDGDTLSEANMGNLFQRGNNYGFSSSTSVTPATSTTQVDTSSYGPENPYYSSTYIIDNKNWQSTTNGDLWGGESLGTHCQSTISSNANYIAGNNVTIEEVCESDMRGPAPSGFHVPLNTEWQAVYDVWTALGGGSKDGTNFGIALKLPFAGLRNYSSAGAIGQGTFGNYWSSSRYNASYAYLLNFNSTALNPQSYSSRAYGYSVRCFKNSPTVPTSTWTKLYGTSIESGGIFWSSADGLISLSSNGQTWITIADKNLGATTVWNSGDTLSEANCGKYYQWGNNYGFTRTGSVTTSSTQVDASNYGPGNYYSSSTFIIYEGRWDTTDNGNLRGGVSQLTQCGNMISATDNKATWGNITGTLADQTDLNTVLGGKQDTLTAGSNVTIEEVCESDMRGPAPSGYHVPSISEMNSLCGILTTTFSLPNKAVTMGTYLKMPMAGFRVLSDASIDSFGSGGMYWTSSPEGGNDAYVLNFSSSGIYPQTYQYRSYGFSIRCFKNSPVIPDSSWTPLYQGMLADSGVFWNSTDGLISISGDGFAWITIADKNLGATTVYNYGDTLTDANCGGYFQWGNNYMFPAANSSETITTSSTQVDVSGYGPGNYYSSSTWITIYTWQDATSDGTNLWGGVTQGTQCGNMISATDTTYESKTAASGGTDVSLVTTGEKYTWNNKANASDITTKTYYTTGTMSVETFMDILNGLAASHIAPIIVYASNTTDIYYYDTGNVATTSVSLYFYAPSNGVSNGTLYNKKLTVTYNMTAGTVTLTKSNESLAVGGGDMSYSDFGWQAKTGATITLDLASTYTPSANFTVNAPSTIKDGQTYILRVNNGATAYTMTLGTNITNPFATDTTLTANGIDQFVFLAIGGSLELQPEGGGGGIAPAANSPINVKYIWAGTQAQYEALSSYDDNTVYLTV